MPINDLDDELDDDFEDDEQDEEDQVEEQDEEDKDDEQDSSDKSDKSDKRIRDLQSKADKEAARANKAEQELKALREKQGPGSGKTTPEVPAEVQQWLDAAKTGARTRMYESDPRFKAYEIDPSLIQGGTPEEMEASFKALARFVDRVERKARRAVLAEHGLGSPEPSAQQRTSSRKSFSEMSDKEFQAVVAKATGGFGNL